MTKSEVKFYGECLLGLVTGFAIGLLGTALYLKLLPLM